MGVGCTPFSYIRCVLLVQKWYLKAYMWSRCWKQPDELCGPWGRCRDMNERKGGGLRHFLPNESRFFLEILPLGWCLALHNRVFGMGYDCNLSCFPFFFLSL